MVATELQQKLNRRMELNGEEVPVAPKLETLESFISEPRKKRLSGCMDFNEAMTERRAAVDVNGSAFEKQAAVKVADVAHSELPPSPVRGRRFSNGALSPEIRRRTSFGSDTKSPRLDDSWIAHSPSQARTSDGEVLPQPRPVIRGNRVTWKPLLGDFAERDGLVLESPNFELPCCTGTLSLRLHLQSSSCRLSLHGLCPVVEESRVVLFAGERLQAGFRPKPWDRAEPPCAEFPAPLDFASDMNCGFVLHMPVVRD
eukprot:TRINITY_DN292_c0_g1_i1.p1 TRINITY_DN292_c0_g1~~TRINITY_DN292_c0_g1_i1.p1  ORF type:complete len:257 (-),score=51.25 TRINITY_DN292_c0_g1_i1:579-1349(-)